ncbi:MAG: hypothetical protein HC927_09225 [Deltaproteobacteria bacterium]|nr:hypothetical protein [Deltaproteobacteria bacterium]
MGVVIFDLRAADQLPSNLRRRVGDFRAAIDPQMRRIIVDELMIIDSPIVRGAITAVRWIHPKMRYNPVASMAQAIERACQSLRDHGIEVPAVAARDFDGPPDAMSRSG